MENPKRLSFIFTSRGNDIANGNLLQLDNAEGLTYLNIAPCLPICLGSH